MDYNLSNFEITAIIPIKIDSADRKKNVIMSVEYLLKNHNCKVMVTEVDNYQKLMLLQNPKLSYEFIATKENTPFYRTKILNNMLLCVETPYVINYDCDMLLSKSTMEKCLKMLKEGYDLVYPYPKGNIYYTSTLNDIQRSFISKEPTEYIDYLIEKYMIKLDNPNILFFKNTPLSSAVCAGGMQFFNTQSYKSGFGENEEFIDWGPEDYERLYRFYLLEYKIGWIDCGNIFHMDHEKTKSALNNSQTRQKNDEIWNKILKNIKTKEDMLKYMHSLNYIKKF